MEQPQVAWSQSEDVQTPASIENNSPPIASLVDELLVEIFLHDQKSCSLPHLHAWIRLTHVCRLWRDIALSTPTLWRTIRIGETLEVPTIHFQRTKDVLLDIVFCCTVPAANVAAVSGLVQQHAKRVRSLVFNRANSELESLLDVVIPLDDPPSVSLDLQTQTEKSLSVLPAPNLRAMDIALFGPARWTQPRILSPLRYLSLCIEHSNLSAFLGSLGSCPHLRDLRMSIMPVLGVLQPATETGPQAATVWRRRCPLPMLRSLTVVGMMEDTHLIFSSIEIPRDATVRMAVLPSIGLGGVGHLTMHQVLAAVPDPRLLGSFPASWYFTIAVLRGGPDSGTMGLTFRARHNSTMGQQPGKLGAATRRPVLGFAMDAVGTSPSSAPSDVTALLERIGELLSPAPVTALQLLLDVPVPPEAWRALFRQLPLLQLLIYEHPDGADEMIPVLEGRDSAGTDSSELLCPALRLITASIPSPSRQGAPVPGADGQPISSSEVSACKSVENPRSWIVLPASDSESQELNSSQRGSVSQRRFIDVETINVNGLENSDTQPNLEQRQKILAILQDALDVQRIAST